MNSHPLRPHLAVLVLAAALLVGSATAALAQAGSPPLAQAIALFDAGQWERAMVEMDTLLASGFLSRSQRSQARKYLAIGNLLLGRDDQVAVGLFKDLVADDPYFGIAELAETPGTEPSSAILRLFAEGQIRWRQEEQDRREAKLRATSRLGAMVRSTALPGTGQFYQGYRGRGYGMIALTGAAAAYAVLTELDYRAARDDYGQAPEGADFDRLYRDYDNAANRADLALGVVAAAWVYNVLDAALSGPNLSGPSKSVAARVRPGGDGQGLLLTLALAF
ncbi:MAG: hypothetical protein ABIL09_06470 [Gemmatimonadota bacterium]